MSKQLHPTRHKCKCGFVGTRNEFYVHMSVQERQLVSKTGKMSIQAFFERHGEVPCYADEPFAPHDYTSALEKADARQKLIDTI